MEQMTAPTSFDAMAVCGAGTMGSGIAQCAAQHGLRTVVYDVSAGVLAKSKLAIESSLAGQVRKQKISAAAAEYTLQRVHFTTNLAQVVAPVVLEAIVEDYSAKVGLFRQLAAINASDTIFATNTSSLSIQLLWAQIDRPIAFAGLHFFNPAPVMKLVELVQCDATHPTTTDALLRLAAQLQKTAVLCTDSPGFVVNRVARPYYLEAMRLVELGVATPEQIDAVLVASGFKMGPFKLMDLIGLDVNLTVSEQLWSALGKPPRLAPSAMQQALVQQGHLGRKTGRGFFAYPA
jgi:3-hydroxybutyryl-CoA dehydrogenase